MVSSTSGFAFVLLLSFFAVSNAQLPVVMSRLLTNMLQVEASFDRINQTETDPTEAEIQTFKATLSSVEPDIANLSSNSLETLIASRASIQDLSKVVNKVTGQFYFFVMDGKAAAALMKFMSIFTFVPDSRVLLLNEKMKPLFETLNIMVTKVIDPFQAALNTWARRVDGQSQSEAKEFETVLVEARKEIVNSLRDMIQALCFIKTDKTEVLSASTKEKAADINDNIRNILYQLRFIECRGGNCYQFITENEIESMINCEEKAFEAPVQAIHQV